MRPAYTGRVSTKSCGYAARVAAPGPDDLEVVVAVSDGVATVTVQGEIDAVTGERFSEALAEAIATSETGIVIDMHEITFFGSEGVRAIVDARRLAADAGRTVAVARPSPVVKRLFGIIGLDELVRSGPAGG